MHINEFSPFSDVFLLSVKNFKLQRKRFGSNSMHFVKGERERERGGGGGGVGKAGEKQSQRGTDLNCDSLLRVAWINQIQHSNICNWKHI